VEGNLEEVGEWSALILTQNALSPGTKVRIWGKTHKIKGYVRSCKYDRMLGFFVDIGLDPGSRWSEKWFRPEHLFALCPSMRYFTEAVLRFLRNFFCQKLHTSEEIFTEVYEFSIHEARTTIESGDQTEIVDTLKVDCGSCDSLDAATSGSLLYP
jgi:hypothetical protein